MKSFIAATFLIVHALLLSVSLPISQCRVVVQTDEHLIESTCRKTSSFGLCVSSLKSDPQSSKADVPGLGLIMVNVIKAKATKTLNHIRVLLKRGPGAVERRALISCVENYEAILKGDVPEAIEALTKGDYKFAEQGSNDAANEANTCEREFTAGTSPLTALNNNVHDVSAIAAAITRTLL
ncbi:hypothetical protein FNV43_RR01037 [Rhamnella rubrinervis]|uniref:Pectinesterase inhibitor domain-containing protein n=1 Tax=Rhamnella rubrinervis TaxID=2594499 RepID=A0A8K0HP34_9ROSA|nr:hypothetical protein FNV43_RR01037 [Rhamnella rubrinervis]